jgi:catechol 2,3-dioxygenase-like lactoylglutathione lyase family enzyme
MLQRVGTVSLFVSDQDRAKQFYAGVLGMELRADAPLYPGATARWVAVAPEGAETEMSFISLMKIGSITARSSANLRRCLSPSVTCRVLTKPLRIAA